MHRAKIIKILILFFALTALLILASIGYTYVLPIIINHSAGSTVSYITLTDPDNKIGQKGKPFDMYVIKDAEILRGALANTDFEEHTTVEAIGQNLVITPVISENGLSQLTAMPDTGLRKTVDVREPQINASLYKIELKDSLGLSHQDTAALLDQIVRSMQEYYKQQFLSGPDFFVSEEFDLTFLDYPERVRLLELESETLVQYADSFAAASPTFVSDETNKSFADMEEEAKILRDIEIQALASQIDSYALTVDPAQRVQLEETQLVRENISLAKAAGREEVLARVVNSSHTGFPIEESLPEETPLENEPEEQNSLPAYYDTNLLQWYVACMNDTLEKQLTINKIQNKLQTLQEDAPSGAVRVDAVDASLEQIRLDMHALRAQISQMAEEDFALHGQQRISASPASYEIVQNGNPFVIFLLLLALCVGACLVYQFVVKKVWIRKNK